MSGESITCPVCGRTSYHPTDVDEGWCNACHGATGHPPPPGMRWVRFTRKGSPAFGRLLDEHVLEAGMGYAILAGDEAGDYIYDGDVFVETEAARS